MCELNQIICKTVECQAKVTIVSQYHSLLFYFNEQYINLDQRSKGVKVQECEVRFLTLSVSNPFCSPVAVILI